MTITQGEPPNVALTHGVAAGITNAYSAGGAHFDRKEFYGVLADIVITEMPPKS